MARQHLADIRSLDRDIKANQVLIRQAVTASDTTVTDIYGVGPVVAALLIGYTGNIGRFATAGSYAAYNGTAPVEYSSGGKKRHRLSMRGNRVLNHALHMAAITQIRYDTAGPGLLRPQTRRRQNQQRSAASVETPSLSNVVYRHLVAHQQQQALLV